MNKMNYKRILKIFILNTNKDTYIFNILVIIKYKSYYNIIL
jgi:hypothetical protein